MVSVFAGMCAVHPLRLARGIWLGLFCAVTWACAAQAWAQEPPQSQAQRLVQAGQWSQALELAQTHLAEHPKDVQMRLLLGVVLQRTGQRTSAQATFEQLTRDHPELPEPYNNLAVLQAQAGDVAQALSNLEQAVRLNPQYGTAHHNMADVYTQLAAQAYLRAADLDDSGQAPTLRQRAANLNQLLTTRIPQ
jgi:Flp pilus assembly protein TadD